MNTLPAAGTKRWELPRHAHVVVYDAGEEELLTIYDCGVAQSPPSAQLRGHLVNIRAANQLSHSPTGYRVSLREPAYLVDQDDAHYVIEPRDDPIA